MEFTSTNITGRTLSIEEVVAVAYRKATVNPLNEETKTRMEESNKWLQNAIFNDKELFYGINTGFGSHANQAIDPEKARELRDEALAERTAAATALANTPACDKDDEYCTMCGPKFCSMRISRELKKARNGTAAG